MNMSTYTLQTRYNNLQDAFCRLEAGAQNVQNLNNIEEPINQLQQNVNDFSNDLAVAMSNDNIEDALFGLVEKATDLDGRVNGLRQDVQQRIGNLARIIIEPSDKKPVTSGPQKRKFEDDVELEPNKKIHHDPKDMLKVSVQLTLPNENVISLEPIEVPYSHCKDLPVIVSKVNFSGEKTFSFKFQGEESDLPLYQHVLEHLGRFLKNPADYSASDLNNQQDIETLFKLLETAEMYELNNLKEKVGEQLASLLEKSELETSKETLLGYLRLFQNSDVRHVLSKKLLKIFGPEDSGLLEELRSLVAHDQKLSIIVDRLIALNTIKMFNINDPEDLRQVPSIQRLAQEPPKKGSFQVFFKTLTGTTLTVELQHGMNIEKIKSLLLPRAQECMGRYENPQITTIEDLRIIIGGKELENSEILDDYKPQTLATIHLIYRLGGVAQAFSHIHNTSLQDRVVDSVAYITNFDNRLQKGLYDQEINISDVRKHIQTLEEARNSVQKEDKTCLQGYLNCAQRVLDIAPMVNRLVHLSGNQYDGIRSKLTGATLQELEPYNKKNPTFIQRLTNELRRIYKVESGETIQGYSMRVESALHMMSKALEILQESPETDREIERFFLDSIDRVWDSYLAFLYEKISRR